MIRNSLITCLCVTHNRVELLKRAVACYLDQKYRFRELLVAYNANDEATRQYLNTLCEPSVSSLELPNSRDITLGAMRNSAVQAARGQFIAQWDDDDWHSPYRLTKQMQVIQQSGKPNCVLSRLVLYDSVTQKAYLSQQRCWEGSLVGQHSTMPCYADLDSKEDTPVIASLRQENSLAVLDAPQLYVYVYHGSNTCQRQHWENYLFRYAQRLSDAEAIRIRSIL